MIALEASKLFTPWTHPSTGVTIHLLTEKVAPVQEAFYFVNDSMSQDGRYLWFYCAFPPSGSAASGRTLGVVDFEHDEIRHYPETQFQSVSPFVDVASGDVYWSTGPAIWRRGAEAEGVAELVNALPPSLIGDRPFSRLATHLTRSADGKEFFVDAAFGLQWVMGSLPIDGGKFEPWQRFDRNYNHAQFSPTDPDLVLFAEENHSDPITGLRFGIVDRMWLIRRGESARPVFSTPTRVTHEWWDPDGEHVWCVWGNDAWRTNIHTQEVEKVAWPNHCWHAHATADCRYMVADSNERFYRGCPSKVGFLNRVTDTYVEIADNPEMSDLAGSTYHIDPHPRFVGGEQFVVFTTTVRGEVDLAVARTADLIERTS
ncbi:MAG: hypothetical protein ACP5HS_00895 [Anaerolineae bacterium]